MALVIPRSVGGDSDLPIPETRVEPVEARANRLVIPASVGGDFVPETQQPVAQPIEQPTARPLSQIIPEAVEQFQQPAEQPPFG